MGGLYTETQLGNGSRGVKKWLSGTGKQMKMNT